MWVLAVVVGGAVAILCICCIVHAWGGGCDDVYAWHWAPCLFMEGPMFLCFNILIHDICV